MIVVFVVVPLVDVVPVEPPVAPVVAVPPAEPVLPVPPAVTTAGTVDPGGVKLKVVGL